MRLLYFLFLEVLFIHKISLSLFRVFCTILRFFKFVFILVLYNQCLIILSLVFLGLVSVISLVAIAVSALPSPWELSVLCGLPAAMSAVYSAQDGSSPQSHGNSATPVCGWLVVQTNSQYQPTLEQPSTSV